MNKWFIARATGHTQQSHVKGRKHSLNLLADGSIAHQQHRLAGQLLQQHRRIDRERIACDSGVTRAGLEAAIPQARALDIKIERKVLQHGQNCADGPLRRGDVMCTLSVADGHMRAHRAGNPLCTCHQR